MGWYRGGDAGGRGDIKLISRPQACFDYGERQPAPARQSSYAALPLALLAQPKQNYGTPPRSSSTSTISSSVSAVSPFSSVEPLYPSSQTSSDLPSHISCLQEFEYCLTTAFACNKSAIRNRSRPRPVCDFTSFHSTLNIPVFELHQACGTTNKYHLGFQSVSNTDRCGRVRSSVGNTGKRYFSMPSPVLDPGGFSATGGT